ncbi:biopolymer transporter ExbD [Blastopirellula sp. JC732]|uniref:Biopolymer transporter ExbD n=1 Tax=Blastopirellula sediminis TaxID=2894196 RepID=A0A9X1MMT1_9BACT|nr:biopolymer transporter ExbD [Blastopirellula sediminis]MCC9607246.1 biopolymer transporter ExbD [Blastopirellula sediminis]MCC9629461.1 biopolymer transporter ExbD [Blastopirellula sediminis]
MRRVSPYMDRQSLQIAMTPMIDVVFLLLVFFLWTASFQVVEYSLPSTITPPMGTGANVQPPPEMADFEQVVVRLTMENDRLVWKVNDQPRYKLPEVRQLMQVLATIKNDVPLVIDADGTVGVGDVIDIYDLARELNFQDIQFAVDAKS